MVVGIGLDIVMTERLTRALDAPGDFEHRVFTPGELAACASRCDRVQALAARFAAKEACLKALGIGIDTGVLLQVEVVPGASGAPRLRLTGPLAQRARRCGVQAAHVSLTHEPGLAAALVVLEGTSKRPTSA
jgi:holo-[acyl-carrier protein] synthase